jgi:hypothetical protein
VAAVNASRWIRVNLPYAVFALGCRDGLIAEAPPIAKWAMGKPEAEVAEFYRSKGATFDELPIAGRRGRE